MIWHAWFASARDHGSPLLLHGALEAASHQELCDSVREFCRVLYPGLAWDISTVSHHLWTEEHAKLSSSIVSRYLSGVTTTLDLQPLEDILPSDGLPWNTLRPAPVGLACATR